jgi:hypothetical protein
MAVDFGSAAGVVMHIPQEVLPQPIRTGSGRNRHSQSDPGHAPGEGDAFSTGSTDIEKCQQDWQTGEKPEREEKRGNRCHNREHRDARTYVATASLLAYRHGRMVGAGTAGTSVSQVSSSGRFSPLLGRKSRRSTRRVRSLADELDLLVEEQHAVVRQCSNMSPECDDYLTGDRPSSQAGALARPEATSGGRHLGSASA